MNCRFCNHDALVDFADLGFAPPSNSFLTKGQLSAAEAWYPLIVKYCPKCHLVQADEFKKHADIFNEDYIYFSSNSTSWLKHAKDYVNHIADFLNLNHNSFVIEIASNDGYLLKNFVEKKIPSLGVEPTLSTAKVAQQVGVNTLVDYWEPRSAAEVVSKYKKADLILGNNVLAHVPDISSFAKGVEIALAEDGVFNFEFPHLLNLINENQFDTIYHEHFSYLSLIFCNNLFKRHGLEIFKVKKLGTHGGSLRVYGKKVTSKRFEIDRSVFEIVEEELKNGLADAARYDQFSKSLIGIKHKILEFIVNSKAQNKKIALYGAAAKGNTLLNYCRIDKDSIDYVIDASINKIGTYLPGSHIPVISLEAAKSRPVDIMIIMPWNLKEEIKPIIEKNLGPSEVYTLIPNLKKLK